ncbi:UNVERIFIED_CONTAM: hypothetical protein RMT77_010094 [Armadillidium vulgare]
MKNIVVLPYADYEKMKYIKGHQQKLQQQQHYSLYDPRAEKLNNYETEFSRILNSNIDVHEKCISYEDEIHSFMDLKELQHKTLLSNSKEKYTPPLPSSSSSYTEEERGFQNILE